MFYWSRWANIAITGVEPDHERETYRVWQDTGYRLQRETRPVVVIRKSNTQVRSAFAAHQQSRERGRNISSHISLDVRRQSYARTSPGCSLSSTGTTLDATTEAMLVKQVLY